MNIELIKDQLETRQDALFTIYKEKMDAFKSECVFVCIGCQNEPKPTEWKPWFLFSKEEITESLQCLLGKPNIFTKKCQKKPAGV